ncbi:hypothetical protein HDV06_001478 [Boothiomyces sp. JEL0866]|nr:hypothetical protein HDV06_001478 [Boothiomyces sp. JEL0866]
MTDLNTHPSYTADIGLPDIVQIGAVQYLSVKPIQSTSFSPNDTIQFKISSPNQLWTEDRTYLKYTITPSVTGATNGNYLNPMGSTAIFASVTEQYAGTIMPVYNNWNVVNQIKNYTSDQSRKNIIAQCESFTDNTTGTLQIATSTNYISPLPLGTNWDGSQIPLLALNGGATISLTLDKASNVFTTGTYTVTNVELVCHLVTPSSDVLHQLDDGLRKGSQLKIPVKLYKSIPYALSGATTQDLLINTGYVSSLNSIACVTHDSSSGFFNNSNIVQDWYININGLRYPQNKNITAGIETIYQQLASQNTVYSKLNYSVQPFQYFSWKSTGDFATGIPSNNSQLDVQFDYTGAPSGATTYFIVGYDAIVSINLAGVNVNTGPF